MDPTFFDYFLQSNSLVIFGLMLLSGLLGGQLLHMTKYLPRITGYIAIGFVLGPQITNLLTESLLDSAHLFQEIAIGIILFELGLRINLIKLWNDPTLLWVSLFQSGVVFAVVFIGLMLCRVDTIVAALAASVGVSISPAITLLIANEYSVNGTIVKKSLILTALNNLCAFLLYGVTVAIVQRTNLTTGNNLTSYALWLYPIFRMLGAIVLAVIFAMIMIWIGRFIGKKENLQFILRVGIMVLALGVSKLLYVSPFLTMLALGIVTFDLDTKHDLMEVELGYMAEIFMVVLFVGVGAHLNIQAILTAGWLALVFIALRVIGHFLPLLLLKAKLDINKRQALSLTVTQMPMAGVALALLSTTQHLVQSAHISLSSIVFPAVAFLELIGPITTTLSLKFAGELDSSQAIEH